MAGGIKPKQRLRRDKTPCDLARKRERPQREGEQGHRDEVAKRKRKPRRFARALHARGGEEQRIVERLGVGEQRAKQREDGDDGRDVEPRVARPGKPQ